MEPTGCLLKHIQLTTITNGTIYKGGVDYEGMELPDIELELFAGNDKREYTCQNCGEVFDGEDFEPVKKHLGGFRVW